MNDTTGRSAVSVFDGKTLSYTYENDWVFTNVFDGTTRISEVEGRGTLRETVDIRRIGAHTYFIAWIDDEMGPLSQVIDLESRTLMAAVPVDGVNQVWVGTVTDFAEAQP
ncbi:MAG: hypothetical protein AAGA54_23105 [Myxococcota bacterium]